MVSELGKRQSARWRLKVLTALVAVCGSVSALRADNEGAKPDSSLQWVPADAAFYSALLHNREQIDRIAHSRAWEKLRSLPFVKMMWQHAKAQLHQEGSPFEQYRKLHDLPENQELIRLLAEMGSNEIFCYGDADFVPFASAVSQVVTNVRFDPALMKLSGQDKDEEDKEEHKGGQAQRKALIEGLSEHIDQLTVPNFILGFKIGNRDRARAQLQRLEEALQKVIDKEPKLKGRLHRNQAGDADVLELALDGGMVPWQKVLFNDDEDEAEEHEDLLKKLQALKLFVHVGLRQNYVLASIGATADTLGSLGKGESLATRSELKPLQQYADRTMVAISYISKELRAQLGTSKKDIDEMMKKAESYVSKTNFPEETQERIRKDMEGMAEDLKGMMPEPGAMVDFSFMTDRGYERYQYDWEQHPRLDGSKPLTILNHVGGDPVLATAGRSKPSSERYQLVSKWLKKADGYFQELVLPLLGEEKQEQYHKVSERIYPLLRRLDEATSKELLPALADGQWAFVVDAKLASRRWYSKMPAAEKPLPIIEPALVLGVSDPALLRKAFRDYRVILNDLMKEARTLSGEKVPEVPILEPAHEKGSSGTLYYYSTGILQLMGVDAKFAPAAGLSDKFFVLAISHEHAERLLADTPLKSIGGPLAETNRPMAEATCVNWPVLVNAAAPWVDYAVMKPKAPAPDGEEESDEPDDQPKKAKPSEAQLKQRQAILAQAHTFLDVLKCFKGYSSSTEEQEGAWVTHGESIFHDLPEGGGAKDDD